MKSASITQENQKAMRVALCGAFESIWMAADLVGVVNKDGGDNSIVSPFVAKRFMEMAHKECGQVMDRLHELSEAMGEPQLLAREQP